MQGGNNKNLDNSTILDATTNKNNKSFAMISTIIPRKDLSKEELRKNAICEIFYFYSRQHNKIYTGPTFDMIKHAEEHLELSEFQRFCSEFKIGLKPKQIADLFKKTTDSSHQMTLDEFTIILQKLSVEINNDKKKFIEDKIKVLEEKLKGKNEGEEVKKESKSKKKNKTEADGPKEEEEKKEEVKEEVVEEPKKDDTKSISVNKAKQTTTSETKSKKGKVKEEAKAKEEAKSKENVEEKKEAQPKEEIKEEGKKNKSKVKELKLPTFEGQPLSKAQLKPIAKKKKPRESSADAFTRNKNKEDLEAEILVLELKRREVQKQRDSIPSKLSDN